MPDSLHLGWSPSLDIADALRRASVSRSDYYVLVSMIDSGREVARTDLVPLLERLGVFFAEVEDDVAIEFPTALALYDEHEFLWGFDEMWLCTEMPKWGKPGHLKITSDRSLGPEPPGGLADWMLKSSCRAGLGDGVGLNFVTFDSALAALWSE